MTTARHHLESLDAFRGLTVAGMILVNNPGDWTAVFPTLLHADWNGCTLADLVFPFFLVILGLALPLALSRRRQSGHRIRTLHLRFVRRALLLFALGLLLNAVAAGFSWPAMRVPGVLQRIALVYLLAATVTLHADARVRAGIAALLFLVHRVALGWATLTPGHNLAATIDRAVFGSHTLTPRGDPEGLLGTLPAVATALVGAVAGQWLCDAASHRARVAGLTIYGGGALLAGLAWSAVWPLNKTLWTGSYALVAAGLALLVFTACYWLIDLRGVRRWASALVWLGVNPLAVYFLAELAARILDATNVKTILFWSLLAPLLVPRLGPAGASLVYAVLTVALWTALAGALHHRGVRVQV